MVTPAAINWLLMPHTDTSMQEGEYLNCKDYYFITVYKRQCLTNVKCMSDSVYFPWIQTFTCKSFFCHSCIGLQMARVRLRYQWALSRTWGIGPTLSIKKHKKYIFEMLLWHLNKKFETPWLEDLWGDLTKAARCLALNVSSYMLKWHE